MNLESGLISKIVSRDDLLFVLDERITEAYFDEYSEVYRAILDYYTTYSTVPERETLNSFFPNFQFVDNGEPLRFYVDKLKEKYKKNLYNKGLVEVAELIKSDVEAAEKKLQALLTTSKTNIKTGVDLDVRLGIEARKTEYLNKKDHLGVDGYETPWESLNNYTCGYHNGELIVWTAKPKMCKSWLLIWQARHIWRECGVPVLFLTREMRPESIQTRLHAVECKLPYDLLKRGLLSDEQQKAYFNYLDSLAEVDADKTFTIIGYDLTDCTGGVSSIVPKVERYLMNGGVLFVDGIYLLPDDRGEKDWKAIVNVSTDLKNLAQSYNIPVVATTQHNMEDKSDVPRFDGVAYGKYLVQFVDALIGISRSPTDRNLDRGRVHILAQREGDIGDFPINMKFNPIDFSQAYEKTVEETNYEDEDDEDMKY